MKPSFFPAFDDFYEWMERHHENENELWVGFYKKATGIPSITWPESVDVALCFGWIDGIRKSIDEKSYKIRFTPRKQTSHWSDVNIKRLGELKKTGLVHNTGLSAFKRRKKENSRRASYEQKFVALDINYEKQLKENTAAWEYFQSKAPAYRKQCTWWIMSAKKEDTRLRRLKTLIQSNAEGNVIPPLKWSVKKKK